MVSQHIYVRNEISRQSGYSAISYYVDTLSLLGCMNDTNCNSTSPFCDIRSKSCKGGLLHLNDAYIIN